MKKILCLLAVLCLATALCGVALAEQANAPLKAAAYPPTNVKVESIATNQMEISWNAGVGATLYNIYRTTDETKESSWKQVEGGGGVSGTSFIDTENLKIGTTYYYRIQSVGGSDYSAKGGDGHYAHDVAQIYQPKGLTFDGATMNSVKISWNEDPGVEEFWVYYGTTNACSEGPEPTQKNNIEIKGLTESTTYYVKVVATLNSGADKSDESTLLTTCTTPKDPKGLKTTIKGTSAVTLSWTAATSPLPDGYEVWRSDNGAAYKRIKQITSGSTRLYKDTGLTAGVTYAYKIRAYKNNGTKAYYSDYSLEATTIPQALAPQNVTAVHDGVTSVKVTWKAVSGASGYFVKAKKSTDPDTEVVTMATITSPKTLTATITGLTTGTEYTFYVCAFTTTSTDTVEGMMSASATAIPMPTAPKSLTVTSKNEQEVEVSWTGSEGADGFTVYYSEDSSFPSASTTSFTTTDTSCTISGLTGGKVIYVKVVPYVKVDGVKKTCDKAEGKATPLPVTPGDFSVKQELTTVIRAQWTAVSFQSTNESGYQLQYRKKGDTTWSTVLTVADPSVYDHVQKGMSVGYTYQYRLRAYTYCNGVQVWSKWTSVLTVKCDPLAPSKVVLTSPKLTAMVLTITADTNAGMKYEVYRSTSEKGTYIRLGAATVEGTNKLTYTDTKSLKKNTVYYYKVRGYVTISGEKVWSDFSKVVSGTTKPAQPGSPTATQYDNGVAMVTWKTVKNVAGYEIYRSTKETSGYSRLEILTKASSHYKDGTTLKQYADEGVSNGKTYYYKIRTFIKVSGKTIYGEYTAPVKASIVSLPTKPTSSAKVKASAYGARKIRVKWNAVSGATSYRVYASETKSGYYHYAGKSNSTELVVTKINGNALTWGKTYYFKLKPDNAALSSAVSCAATPVVPANVKVTTVSAYSVKIEWDQCGGAEGYEVEYKLGSAKKWTTVTIKKPTTVKTTVKKMTVGGKYSFRVRSWRTVSKKKVYSPYCSTITYQN